MLIYFLRIIQYFLMKFCTVILGMILVVNTLKQSPPPSPRLLWEILGYFWGLFWHMYLFLLIFVQYIVIKFCSGVPSITLNITKTCFLASCPPSSGGHFRVFWGLFWHITSVFWEPFSMSCQILYRPSWWSFWASLHYFFHIMTLLGTLRWIFLGSFWAMFI